MKQLTKQLFRKVFGDYELYSIYVWEKGIEQKPEDFAIRQLSIDDLLGSSSSQIRKISNYAGGDAYIFGVEENDNVLCACCYWHNERYPTERGFWRLEPQEAKLVQIVTAREARNRGLARQLISASGFAMSEKGFNKLYARIWKGHRASERAFEAAKWSRCATVVGIEFLGRRIRLRLARSKFRSGTFQFEEKPD